MEYIDAVLLFSFQIFFYIIPVWNNIVFEWNVQWKNWAKRKKSADTNEDLRISLEQGRTFLCIQDMHGISDAAW